MLKDMQTFTNAIRPFHLFRLKDLLDSTSTSDDHIIESSPLLCLQRPSQWSASNAKVADTLSDAVLSDDAGLSPPKCKRSKGKEQTLAHKGDHKGSVILDMKEDVQPVGIADECSVESESDDEAKVHSLSYSWPVSAGESQNESNSIDGIQHSDGDTKNPDSLLCGGDAISSGCSECGSQDLDSDWGVCSTPGLQSRPNIHVLSALHRKLSVEQYLPLQCVRDLLPAFAGEDKKVHKDESQQES